MFFKPFYTVLSGVIRLEQKETNKHFSRLWWYLILVIALSAVCFVILNVELVPYSIAYNETGEMTVGYFLYAVIGLLFSTPTPFIAVLIISLFLIKSGSSSSFVIFFIPRKS